MKAHLTPLLVVALAFAAPTWPSTPEEELALGIQLVEEGDFQAAVDTLEAVTQRLAADKAKSKDLARAYVYTAMAYVGLSQETAAKAKFLEAWRSDAALKLSPKEFPPRVIQTFEQAIREARNVPLDPGSVTLLLDAAKRGDVVGMRHLLQRAPALLNGKEPEFGASALHWATLRGNTLAVAFLVGAGADLAAKNTAGETAAEVAQRSKKGDLLPFVQPPPPGPRASPDEVFEAAKRGDIGRLRQILATDPGAVGRKDEFGGTPLHWAALKGYAATAAFLLGAGADPAATNRSGETPLVVAQQAGKPKVAELLAP